MTTGSGPPGGPEEIGLFAASIRFTPDSEMAAVLARNWWVVALRGVMTLMVGLIALFLPGVTLTYLVLLFAAYMLVDGVCAIVSAVRAARRHERWGLLVFEGVIDLLAGALAIVWPLMTLVVLVSIMGAWAIVSGVLMLAAAFRLHVEHGKWLMVLGGIVSAIWGILLLLWPVAGAIVLTWWMGAYALVFGVTLLVLSFRLRAQRPQAMPSAA